MNSKITLTDIMQMLPDVFAQHARSSATYSLLEQAAAEAVAHSRFTKTEEARQAIGGLATSNCRTMRWARWIRSIYLAWTN